MRESASSPEYSISTEIVSRGISKISEIASVAIKIDSSCVRAWEIAPGTAGTSSDHHPCDAVAITLK